MGSLVPPSLSALRSDGGSLRRRQCLSASRASFDSALVAKLGHVLPRILHDLPILSKLSDMDIPSLSLERAPGVEPGSAAWKAAARPLCHARAHSLIWASIGAGIGCRAQAVAGSVRMMVRTVWFALDA